MDDFLERINKLSPKRLALLALEQHEQLEASRRREHEPLAVIGMACRLPGGANDPQAFWELLRDGRDAIGDVPAERWDIEAWFDADPDAPGRMAVRNGGFLDDVSGFDNAFFGISPREALTMDPQQRLLLECCWHALEDAALSPDRLAGSATGVFVGICNSDHFQRVLEQGVENIDAYLASGNAHSVAAGRISYSLGLQGPALSIDTACSSSLVALHVACRSLRSGESDLAIAAGVNLMCSPQTTVTLTKAHMLAPDGRCKTFDASADGFARGEGCGVLVLKRLSDARRDGDRVLALVRGSAINQDGRSGGLTVPNGPAQEAVIRAALADAELQPGEIDYVEAHGTGTTLGDPIEVRALAQALARGRSADEPLLIGSVKTNLGHLESAAGIAGVIKVILSLQHEAIPPHLHFSRPSPHIDWTIAPLRVTAQGCPWPRGARPRRAGVSSFGFSGTNAHVLLEEAPPAEAIVPSNVDRPLHCLPLSARSEAGLVELAGRMARRLADGRDALADVAHSAGVGRSHFAARAAVLASQSSVAHDALLALARGESHPALLRGVAEPGKPPEVVFMYTGQGSQYPAMSRQLYDSSPVYSEIIDRCDELLGADAQGRTLRSVLHAEDSGAIHETAWTQPALFAVEYALTELWRSWGVEPAAVIGHSVGEYVAACVAGVFTLEQGLALIAERGRLMQALPAGGAMAAVFAPVEQVQPLIAGRSGQVSIAAINAPDSVVISGAQASVDEVLAELATRHVEGQRLFVSLAAHSPLVEPALDAMQACAEKVPMRAPRMPVAWNLTGGVALAAGAPDAAYWRRHLREPVRFAEGLEALHRDGYRVFLEVGPHPTLVALAQRCLPEAGSLCLGSLRRGKDDWGELMGSLAQLYVHGAGIDWAGLDRPYARQRVALPGYAFEHRRFWIGTTSPTDPRPAGNPVGMPLLGRRLSTALPLFETLLTPRSLACLADHRVHGAVLLAGPVFLEMAQAAARQVDGEGLRGVRDFRIREPLVLGEEGRVVQVQLGEDEEGARRFTVHSRGPAGDEAWCTHAVGTLVVTTPQAAVAGGHTLAISATQDALGAAQPCDGYYQRLQDLGIELGEGFRSLVLAHVGSGEALAQIALPATAADDRIGWVHPALFDGALQAVGLAVPASTQADTAYLLTEIERLDLLAPLPDALWCHARVLNAREVDPVQWQAEVTLRSLDGRVLGVIHGVQLQRASRDALARAAGQGGSTDLFHRLSWLPVPLHPVAATQLAGPAQFVAGLQLRFAELARQHGLEVYAALQPELDRLSAGFAAAALRGMGFDATTGRRFRADDEARRLGVIERHQRLFSRLLAMLAEDGVLRREGGQFEIASALPTADAGTGFEALMARFGTTTGELSTLRRCGPELARVLLGEQDPLQLLFPGGSFAEARALYVDSPFAQTYNRALGEAMQAAIARLPEGSPLRVLEIGAGTGGTTTYVLPLLPPQRTAYTFTDLSPLFLERAAEQFAAYPFVRHALLDIERDPLAQGFEAGSFDIVIAANVLHATADLRQTLAHTRRLMAPGALLLLLEGVAPQRWVDLSFGLTEGWWRFTDRDLRPDYPLIGRGGWLDLLNDAGFTEAAAVPGDGGAVRGAVQQALIVARAAQGGRQWALVGGEGDIAAALAERLRSRGDAVACLPLQAPESDLPPIADLVYLGALELASLDLAAEGAAQAAATRACTRPLRWLQAVAARHGRAWLVTQGAQAGAGDAAPGAVWQAPLWGLGRGFALEQPGRWGGLVDLPLAEPQACADLLLRSLDGNDGEDQCAWRGDQRLVLRLQHDAAPPPAAVALHGDATYLVTGGFGGLGLQVARWLVDHGARHIALLGRRADMGSEAVRALQQAGAEVIALEGDVADEGFMTGALARLHEQSPPLRGVLHAAAALSAAPLAELGEAQVLEMLRPKLEGSLLVERLTRDAGVDFLVLFSSSTALLGATGLAHYAAANAVLDALALATDAPSRRVLSIDWGTWEVMRLATAESRRSYREGGLLPMPAADGLDALSRLLAAPRAQSMVAKIDWPVLKALHEARRPRPLLALLGRQAQTARPAVRTGQGPGLAERLAALPVAMRHDLLVEFVRHEAVEVLGLDKDTELPVATGLFDLGMDSLMSVELKRRLERGTGRTLPSTLTFNYPNVVALARFLETVLEPPAAPPPHPARSEPAAASGGEPVRPAADLDAELDALSEEELEARLMARLGQIR